jgi:hypothetical protein
VHLHIQLDVKNLAVEYILIFLSLLSSGQPGWTDFYFLHFGNTCSLVAIKCQSLKTLTMARKGLWILVVILAIVIGLYPSLYFFIDRKFGLLSTKSDDLLTNISWNIGFYTHIIFGGLALTIGWTQFNSNFRNRNLLWHRRIGMFYIVTVILSSLAGMYIGFFATGGFVSSLGFICLGVIWFSTTVKAYVNIKNRQIETHQKMMIYSYAACFAAVTLRIWLPLLTILFDNFVTAYTIVAWLCWVPNIFVAYQITRRINT